MNMNEIIERMQNDNSVIIIVWDVYLAPYGRTWDLVSPYGRKTVTIHNIETKLKRFLEDTANLLQAECDTRLRTIENIREVMEGLDDD